MRLGVRRGGVGADDSLLATDVARHRVYGANRAAGFAVAGASDAPTLALGGLPSSLCVRHTRLSEVGVLPQAVAFAPAE
jgi:hypothetical protein